MTRHRKHRFEHLEPTRTTTAAILLLLMMVHLISAAARLNRDPAPEKTFHDHDEHLVLHPLVFRGEKRAPQLPLAELIPSGWDGIDGAETLDAAFANSPERTRSYRTATPLHFVVTAIPATVLGVNFWTVRLGPVAVLWALLLMVYVLGRRTGGSRKAGLASAVIMSALPAVHQGVLVGVPALGNMLGVTMALVALHHSDGLRRWGWALAAGVMLAMTSRWGESVGDGLECLVAVGGPAVLCALVAPWRLLFKRTRGWAISGLLGGGLAGYTAWALTDRWWLQTHLERYILAQAGVTGPSPSITHRVANALEVLERTWSVYPEVLLWSLAGPAATACAVLGAAAWLSAGRQRHQLVWLLSSLLGGGLALSLSDKGQDTYAVGLLPAFAIIAGGGLSQLRWGRGSPTVIAVALVALTGLFQMNIDLPVFQRIRCQPSIAKWVTGDAERCAPTRTDLPAVYHWFREWRREPNAHDQARTAIGRWLRDEEGQRWLLNLAPNALVLLQRPPGPGGGSDVAFLLGQSMRPDVLFHTVRGMHIEGVAGELADAYDDVWVMTFVKDMARNGGVPQEPMSSIGTTTPVTLWRHVHVHKRERGDTNVEAGSGK